VEQECCPGKVTAHNPQTSDIIEIVDGKHRRFHGGKMEDAGSKASCPSRKRLIRIIASGDIVAIS